jgi:peptidoglycan/LPS O-acetylase OafA/YrhL
MHKKIHYSNLNSLRCIAAFVVVFHHIEQIKFLNGYPNLWNVPTVQLLGRLGVDLFFVLSGFLITSLLFIEKETYNKIFIGKFITRRILRIWPLYFAIMIIGFIIMPNFPGLELGLPFVSVKNDLVANFILYVLFMPHVQAAFIGPILYCAQSWSIGIEEEFYIIWPFLVNKYSRKTIAYIIVIFVVAYLAIMAAWRIYFHFVNHSFYNMPLYYKMTAFLFSLLKFDCLLIGGLFAILNNYIKEPGIINKKWFQIGVYLAEFFFVYKAYNFEGLDWEIHSILYGFIILNLVRVETSIISIDFPLFDYLGRISYGIYMYHVLVAGIVLHFCYMYHLSILVYPLTFILVTLVAAFSYKYIEDYFLQKKKLYSPIVTG